jgi:hypothetical protein
MVKTSIVVRACGFAVSAALVGSLLAGCGDRSEANKASHEASLAIGSISAGAGSGSVPEYTIEKLEEARSILNRTGLDGTDAEKAGAVILGAWTELGLASGDGYTISQLEETVTYQMADIRAELRAWEQLNARASAEESFDPASELKALSQEHTAFEARIQAATTAKANVDKRVASLESQMKALGDQARQERQEAAKLELRAAQLSAVAAAEIAPEIQKHALAAEKKLFDIARLKAQADQLGTEATEAALNLEMFSRQLVLNEQARAEILAAHDQAKKYAAELRVQASKSESQIVSAVDALLAFRDGSGADESLNNLYDTQIGRLRSAASNARQGVSEMRVQARVASGAANAALGDALSQQSRSFDRLATLLSRIAGATPPLASADSIEQHATNAARIAAASHDESLNAFKSAADDYSGAGIRGDARELVDALVEKLRTRAGEPASESTEPAETPEGDDASSAQPNED